MEARTELDRFVLAEVASHLGPDEEVAACAYFVESVAPGFGAAAKAKAWFMVLTNENLIRIQTKVGALKPSRENLGVTIDALNTVESVFLGNTLIVRFLDGRELDLKLIRKDQRVSSQQTFIALLHQHFGQGEAAQLLAKRETAFDLGLREMTPHVIVTPLLVAISVAVFVLMVVNGVSPMSPTVPDLLEWGANFGPATTGGEYWRLLTCTFVHIGIIHIAFNMWVLWDLGRLVERMVGNVGFACLYLVSGVFASVVSAWWQPLIVSAGASGAVFGVAGALLGIVLVDRGAIPTKRLAQLRGSVGAFVVYNLVFGFAVPGIDQAAHLGGLAMGIVCGVILAGSASKAGAKHRLRRALVVALLGGLAIPGLAMALPSNLADAQKVVDDFVAVESRALSHINAAAKANATDAEFAVVLETKVLPEWSESRKKLQALEDLPAKFQERVDLLARYANQRELGWTLTLQAIERNDPALVRQAEAKQAEAEKIIEQLNALNKE